MEPTLHAVIEHLQAIEEKTIETLSSELTKIENEFDKEISKSEATAFNSGLFRFNWDLKQKHQEIVNSLLPKSEEILVPEIPELKVEEVSEPVVEPVAETIEPVKIEVESSDIKPKASKPKMKSTEL